MDTRSSTLLSRVAALAALLTSCHGKSATEPAALLASTPEREYLGAEKIFEEKLGAGGEVADNSSQVSGADAKSEAFHFDVPRPTKVVIWSKFIMKNGQFMKRHVPNCELERAFSFDFPGSDNRSMIIDEDYDISNADVVVFNLAPLEQNYVLPRHKPQGQLWVAGCWEPISFDGDDIPGDCSLMNDQATMSQMDGVASYHNNSLFPSFFTPPTESQLRRPAPDFGAMERQELATYVSSDCRVSWRDGWVAAINQTLVSEGSPGVLSYGKCLRTAEEAACAGPEAVQEPSDAEDTIEEWVFTTFANRCMARPFALVAENSLNPWYVTEKIWNALATGAIPVYLGPPEVKALVPPGSVIFAKDYASPQQIADVLLNFGEDDFARARAWKSGPTEQWGMWSRARKLSRATLLPRLCAAGAQRAAVGSLVGATSTAAGGEVISPQVPLQTSASLASQASEVPATAPQALGQPTAGEATVPMPQPDQKQPAPAAKTQAEAVNNSAIAASVVQPSLEAPMPDVQHALALSVQSSQTQTAEEVPQNVAAAATLDVQPALEAASKSPPAPDVLHALALAREASQSQTAGDLPGSQILQLAVDEQPTLAAAASPPTPDVQDALALNVDAAARSPDPARQTAAKALDYLDEDGGPDGDIARIDDFLKRSDQQEADTMAFLSRAVSKIRAGHALRRSAASGRRISVEDLGKDIDDFEKSLGIQVTKGRRI